MRSVDYIKRAEEVRTIADWIEPSRYVDKNAHAASTEAKAELLRVAAMYEHLADVMRRIEHVLSDGEIDALASLHALTRSARMRNFRKLKILLEPLNLIARAKPKPTHTRYRLCSWPCR